MGLDLYFLDNLACLKKLSSLHGKLANRLISWPHPRPYVGPALSRSFPETWRSNRFRDSKLEVWDMMLWTWLAFIYLLLCTRGHGVQPESLARLSWGEDRVAPVASRRVNAGPRWQKREKKDDLHSESISSRAATIDHLFSWSICWIFNQLIDWIYYFFYFEY